MRSSGENISDGETHQFDINVMIYRQMSVLVLDCEIVHESVLDVIEKVVEMSKLSQKLSDFCLSIELAD